MSSLLVKYRIVANKKRRVYILKVRLRNLSKKENKRKKRWKAKKAFRDWKRNLFQAGKDVPDPKSDTNLKCTRSVLDAFKLVTVSDALVDSSLSPIDGLPLEEFTCLLYGYKKKDVNKVRKMMFDKKIYKGGKRYRSCITPSMSFSTVPPLFESKLHC